MRPDISLILVLLSTDTVCSVNETSMAINLKRADLEGESGGLGMC